MIISSVNSFVDFNAPSTGCFGEERDVALPVYDNFGIKFQFQVDDNTISSGAPLYAAICGVDCDTILDNDVEVVELCKKYMFVYKDNSPVLASDFPILVGNYAPQPGQPQVPEGLYTQQQFLDIIAATYETTINGLRFYNCCDSLPVISDIVVFKNGMGVAQGIDLSVLYGIGYVNFPEIDMAGTVEIGECFRYCILDGAKEVISCSNIFKRISEKDSCYTTVFTYYNEGNGYDFIYQPYDTGTETLIPENRIRLFVYFNEPRFPVEENVFRRSDGVMQRLSTIISKEWLGHTSNLSDDQHQKVVIMLKHDVLNVFHARLNINRRMTQVGDYDIQPPDLNIYKVSQAEFRITDNQQSYVNNNCGFECGIEIVPDCEGGGGGTQPCPDQYKVEFQVGVPSQSTYQDDNFIGRGNNQLEVYREGIIQYSISGDYNNNATTGTITFNPALNNTERVAVITI